LKGKDMKRFILLTTLLVFAIAINLSAQTWTAQTSGVTTALTCVSAVDANIGWIGGNAGVILKTTNGGTNWVNVANATVGTADVYAISAISASICLVSTSPQNTFVYRTSDGGTTWTQVFTQVGGFIDDIRFKDANNGFMYGDPVASRWSLWKTTNAGLTWDSAGCFLPTTGTEAGWNNAMQMVGNTIYFGTNNTKIYKSTNFGATGSWTSGPTTGLINTYSVAFNALIGFGGEATAVKSTDGGTTYAAFTFPGTGTIFSINTVPGSGKFWYNRGASIYYSSDNGATFASQFTGTGTYQAMNVILSGSTYRGWSVTAAGLIAKYDETIQVPVPTGTWTEQTSGLTSVLYSVSAVDDNVAWICGAIGKVLRTTNKGVNWVNVSGTIPTANSLYNIYAWDANTAIVTGVNGTNTSIFQTSNGGTTWTTANTHAGFGDDLYMYSATDAYFIGDPAGGNWDLLKSTNAGLNWATWATLPTTNTSGTYNNAACFLGQQIWFESVGLSTIHYSANLGANWVSQTIPFLEITAINFNSTTVGMAGGSSTSAGLLFTTNSGTNWTTLPQTFLGATSVSGIAGAQTSWWVAKQDTTIWYSSNNGTNWVQQYRGPGTQLFYHLTKSRAGATLWAVRSTGGISRYGQPITGVTPISSEVPSSYSLSQNYPNPFNPVTKINYELPKSGLVTMKVYDVLGQEVATLVNEVKNAGTYNVEFNGASLSSGIYFYKLESNGFSDIKKMMLIK
jgi:photosystem II stability/assembly factor-like uncharacterized protein